MELCVISATILGILLGIADYELINLDLAMETKLQHVRFATIWDTQKDFCRMNSMRKTNMRSQNTNFRRNVNNNVRRNENMKGKKFENLNKTFVREGTPARTKVWVEKTKDTSEKNMKSIIVAKKSLQLKQASL